ncbi:hypothetical protein BIFBRE_04972 [Bifidobacterium breve DSM 20213 = JCM 1192]|uniref:Uncharacterized protein n=1 Tax=Bifidobacterium breve DSM 20213 = JCM 1192 TaxID=518634 RepID=D4BS81_BIFBR|nr:hypothetical protein BIFBRE_04972 [Bifidobacterium breve DSM 20213 = JCM 1192]
MVVLHGSFDKTEHRLVYMALATLWKHGRIVFTGVLPGET